MILAQGKFDGLHAGHVRYLRAARELSQGQLLRVLVAPDDYIRETKQREPYWTQRDRAETVLALGCVDDVRLQQSLDGADEIRALKPKFYVKGPDWRGELPDSVLAACQEVGADVVYVDTVGRHGSEARR